MNSLQQLFSGNIGLRTLLITILDWSLVFLLLYLAYQLIRQTRTVWLIRGFLILLGTFFLSNLLGLSTLNFVLDKILIGVAVTIPVIFQPELRRFLEQLGRGDIFTLLRPDQVLDQADTALEQLIEAVQELSEERTGALIVLEGAPIDERLLQDPGEPMEAVLSKSLLLTLFYPKTRLHDGAVIVRDWRIWTASAILPMSGQIPARQLGTRHRAAMGISEQTDALCIVVSEETGSISLAERGKLQRPLSVEQLSELLNRRYRPAVSQPAFTLPAFGSWTRRLFSPASSQPENGSD
jgi:uncharacterized protein (TIGR00159 family)